MPEIIGHEKVIDFLINAYRHNRVGHAYLFFGPRGIGKAQVARFFAQLLNCDNPGRLPCGQCPSCRKIEQGNHPDVFWIRPQEGSLGIKIEAIRQLQERICLKPYEAKVKTFILEEADYLLEEAANCLLKTLEEPAGSSVLILIAEERNRIWPTILSRCQMVRFNALPEEKIERFLLDRRGVEAETARLLSRLAGGSLGRAFSFLEKNYLNSRLSVFTEFFEKADPDEGVWAKREILLEAIEILAGLLRDSILMGLGLDTLLVNIDLRDLLARVTSGYPSSSQYALLERLNSYQDWLEHNANPRLILANLVIDLRRAGKLRP